MGEEHKSWAELDAEIAEKIKAEAKWLETFMWWWIPTVAIGGIIAIVWLAMLFSDMRRSAHKMSEDIRDVARDLQADVDRRRRANRGF